MNSLTLRHANLNPGPDDDEEDPDDKTPPAGGN